MVSFLSRAACIAALITLGTASASAATDATNNSIFASESAVELHWQPLFKAEFPSQRQYQFFNPSPYPVEIKVYGSASQGFPKVYTAPAPPAPFVPIPYPSTSMKIRVKQSGGSWSPMFKVRWQSGPISFDILRPPAPGSDVLAPTPGTTAPKIAPWLKLQVTPMVIGPNN